MDREGELVTAASEIGEIRPQESTGACAADSCEDKDKCSDSADLLVAKPRRNKQKRKPVDEVRSRGQSDSAVERSEVADLSRRLESELGVDPTSAIRDSSESKSASLAAAAAAAEAANVPVSGTVEPPCEAPRDSISDTHAGANSPAVLATDEQQHSSAHAVGDSTHAPTGTGQRQSSAHSTPSGTPQLARAELTPTKPASAGWQKAPPGLTTPCEVVDVSSHNLAEEVDTADEAEVDITTQVATDTDMGVLPPIDANLLRDLERQARYVGDDLAHLVGSMTSNLHAMSAVSRRCMGAYKESVDDLGVNVDESIKSMYLLIAKCESISNDMKPIYNLADQIKSIKRTLTVFEQLCK